MNDTLFPDLAPAEVPPLPERRGDRLDKEERPLSADRRRTLRQRGDVARGRHPLTGSRLQEDPGRTCGSCRFREVMGHHNRTYGKCAFGAGDPDRPSTWPRATHGAGSDVRRWWPGCTDWQPVPA